MPLPESLSALLPGSGLWAHQAEALDLLRDSHHTVIATGTSSGKSLIYQLAIAEASTDHPRTATSLALYPTKALANDQLRAFASMDVDALVADTYDGDSDAEQRAWTRDNANVILTNPEMLHHGILPNHRRWAHFLMGLQYVVVDEIHALRGIFGSHVGNLLRRLRRLCQRYGSDPTFVFTSATIGDPARLATELCGLDVRVVDNDCSPQGERRVLLWNPHETDPARERHVMPSMVHESATVAASLVKAGVRTLVFCRSRKLTELVARQLGEAVGGDGAVRAYRGGFLSEERRNIETALSTGELDAVVATSALELGIDVGGLEAIVLSGFPGTTASMWQQIGRAGRGGTDSLSVVIAGNDQLDQWFMRNPAATFTRSPERAVINVTNPTILDSHIACAAFEQPVSADDEAFWGDALDDSIRRLVVDDQLSLRRREDDTVAVWNAARRPASRMSLRSAGGGLLTIYADDDHVIGTMETSRATSALHPGAVYLHQGRHWRTVELQLEPDSPYAVVVAHDGDTYTQARSESDVEILGVDSSYAVGPVEVHIGNTKVRERVTGYQVKNSETHEVLEKHALDLPATELVTRSFWFTIPPVVLDTAGIDEQSAPGTLHAVEHAEIGILPFFAICDRWDVGGLSTRSHPDTEMPTIFVHEAFSGGVGIAEMGFENAERILNATLGVVERCDCASGCPSCVQSPKCGNWNEPLDKAGAAALLRRILH